MWSNSLFVTAHMSLVWQYCHATIGQQWHSPPNLLLSSSTEDTSDWTIFLFSVEFNWNNREILQAAVNKDYTHFSCQYESINIDHTACNCHKKEQMQQKEILKWWCFWHKMMIWYRWLYMILCWIFHSNEANPTAANPHTHTWIYVCGFDIVGDLSSFAELILGEGTHFPNTELFIILEKQLIFCDSRMSAFINNPWSW